MDDFLGMLRKAADRLLGQGHSYGTATDEVVSKEDPLKKQLIQQAFSDPDPNVEYDHPAQPRLRKMPAREPVRPEQAKPDERIQQAIQTIRKRNAEVDAFVKRGTRGEDTVSADQFWADTNPDGKYKNPGTDI